MLLVDLVTLLPELILTGLGRDTIIVTGAWTNMSVEHTARTLEGLGHTVEVGTPGLGDALSYEWSM